MATYHRLIRNDLHPIEAIAPAGVVIIPYDPPCHHAKIPQIYAQSFDELPWPADWDHISEFDPNGVFLAVEF